MLTQEHVSFILGILAIAGTIFAVYFYFRKPQEKSEQDIAIFGVKFNNLENTVTGLDKAITNIRDNHLHTIERKIDEHIAAQVKNEMLVCEKLAIIQTNLENLIKK